MTTDILHRAPNSYRSLTVAFDLVTCVETKTINDVRDALRRTDIYDFVTHYASCVLKLRTALIELGDKTPLYDPILREMRLDYKNRATDLLKELDAMAFQLNQNVHDNPHE